MTMPAAPTPGPRYAVILRRSDGRAECLNVLHEDEAAAVAGAQAWLRLLKGVTAEVAPVEIPTQGEPVELPEATAGTLFQAGESGREGREP